MDSPCIVVSGLPGSGKSSLAASLAAALSLVTVDTTQTPSIDPLAKLVQPALAE